MLIVKSIEVMEVPEAYLPVWIDQWPRPSELNGFDPNKLVEVKREMVKGRRFGNHRGELVCIGMTQEVQEAIGLPMEAFNNLYAETEKWRNDYFLMANSFDNIQENIKNAGWISRLIYLFNKNYLNDRFQEVASPKRKGYWEWIFKSKE